MKRVARYIMKFQIDSYMISLYWNSNLSFNKLLFYYQVVSGGDWGHPAAPPEPGVYAYTEGFEHM